MIVVKKILWIVIALFSLGTVASERALLDLVIGKQWIMAEALLDRLIKDAPNQMLQSCPIDGDMLIGPAGDHGLTVLHFTLERQVFKSATKSLLLKLIKHLPADCLARATHQSKTVLHYAAERELNDEVVQALLNRLIDSQLFTQSFFDRTDRIFNRTAFSTALARKNDIFVRALIDRFPSWKLNVAQKEIEAHAVDDDKQSYLSAIARAKRIALEGRAAATVPQSTAVTSDDERQRANVKLWNERLAGIDLRVRTIDEFELLKEGMGGTGSGDYKRLYRDKKDPSKKFIINSASFGAFEPGALEAYAGVLYKLLLGPHAPATYFVERTENGKTSIAAALEFNESFEPADEYFMHHATFEKKRDLLPPGRGLGPIIAASMLLGEIDLKGLGSDRSNLGVVKHNDEVIFFKIDHGQSFWFNNKASRVNFDLTKLVNIGPDSKILASLGLQKSDDWRNPFAVTDKHLEEIKAAARFFDSIPQDVLMKILDFAEQQLQKLDAYPRDPDDKDYIGYQDPRLGNDAQILKKPAATFKEAILERFKQLKDAIGDD